MMKKSNRLQDTRFSLFLLGFAGLIFFLSANVSAGVFPGKDWKEVSPESQGLNSAKLQKAVDYLTAELTQQNADAGGILIIRNGYVVWGNKDSYTVYQLASVSKSFLSTGLGLMIEDKKIKLSALIKNIDKRTAEKYPEATIRHFVTMTSGYDGKHLPRFDPPYECDSNNKCDTWDPGTPNEPLFVPGKKFRYWDEAEMEMSYCLGLTGGNPDYVLDLLRKRIAGPIGMENFEWREIETTVGTLPAMNGGLKTSARDLARFGLLFLNQGNWNGRQLINKNWVKEATSVQVPATIPNDETPRAKGSGAYGYNWWINGITPNGNRFLPGADASTYWASGYGTNRCFVVPKWNMIIVRTGEKPGGWTGADAMFNNFLKLIGEAIDK